MQILQMKSTPYPEGPVIQPWVFSLVESCPLKCAVFPLLLRRLIIPSHQWRVVDQCPGVWTPRVSLFY